MPIASLYFTDIGPFDEIEFEFDRQVNVFTGPNNAGKTAALLMLGELLVYPSRPRTSCIGRRVRNGSSATRPEQRWNRLAETCHLFPIRWWRLTKP